MKKKYFIILLFIIGFLSYKTMNIIADEKNHIISKTEDINKYENIVFLGDSIFDWYPIDKIFDDLPIVNSGIAGNKTTDILENLEERVYRYNPTKVFIQIGTNDLKYEDSEELNQEVYENIVKIAESIQKHRKKSEIYIISIYPVNNDLPGANDRHNDEIQSINKKLEKYCAESKNIIYIDAFSALANDEGSLDVAYTKDGLHPNDLGYAKLTEILMKYIYH